MGHRRALDRLAILAFAVGALASLSARADTTAADKRQAEVLFTEGKRLIKEGKIAEGCRKLEGSYKIDPAGGTVLNLGLCHEQEGKIASAWIELKEALSMARKANRKDREQIARSHLDDLEPKLPMYVVIPDRADSPDLRVTVDGSAITEEAWGAQIPIDPGSHEVRATAPGKAEWKGAFVAVEGKKITVRIPALSGAPPPGNTAAPSADPAGPTWLRPTGVAAASIGAAALIVGGVFGGRALSSGDTVRERCGATLVCDSVGFSALQEGRTSATISDVLFASGGAVLGAGAALFVTGTLLTGRKQPITASGSLVTPLLRPGLSGTWIGVEGQW